MIFLVICCALLCCIYVCVLLMLIYAAILCGCFSHLYFVRKWQNKSAQSINNAESVSTAWHLYGAAGNGASFTEQITTLVSEWTIHAISQHARHLGNQNLHHHALRRLHISLRLLHWGLNESFAGSIYKCILVNENCSILIQISLRLQRYNLQ